MSVGLGLNAWLAFGEEVTYGTAVTRTKFLEITDESIEGKQSIISKPALRQISAVNRVQSKKSVEGNFKFQVPFEGAEKLFKHAMGSIAAPIGSGPYTHILTLAAALPVGLTLEVNRDSAAIGGSSAFLYEGCQISKLTLSQQMDDFLMCEISVLGEDWSLAALTSASFNAINGVDYTMPTVSLNSVTANVRSLDITLDNGLAAERYKLGSRLRKGLGRAQTRKVSGKMTLEFEQLTEYNLFLAQTTLVPLTVTWNNGLGGANNKQIILSFPKIAIQGGDPKVSSQGPIEIDIEFDAFMSSAQNDEMGLTLINSTSTAQ